MLDVHPPHTGMHGIKDFLLHIFTITVGLFIALLLEGCVEKIHQHHLRDEADRNIQQEIRYNEHELETTLTATASEQKNLVEVLKFLTARSQNKAYSLEDVNLQYTSGTLSDSNWQTATATGALSFMEYGRVEDFSGAYRIQELFSRLDEQTLDDFLQLQSYVLYDFDPNNVSVEDAKAALPDVRKTLSHVVAMQQIGTSLKAVYEKTLAGK